MPSDHTAYDFFVSYASDDNTASWVRLAEGKNCCIWGLPGPSSRSCVDRV